MRKKSTPPLIRIAHPMAFMALLHQVGAPVDRFLHQSRLPVLCDDADAFVPLPRVWSFFDTAAQREDPALGWRVGAVVGDHGLSISLLQKLETAPTLWAALLKLTQMARTEASDIDMGVHESRDRIFFYTRYPGFRHLPGYAIAQTYQLSVVLGLVRYFLGRHWVPEEIGLEDWADPSLAEEFFPGCRILGWQRAGYIALPRSCLHRVACRTALDDGAADRLSTPAEFDYADTLRSVLAAYLSEGYPSQRFAAELMNTSVRTLTRRLAAQGLTYGALIDELRLKKAKENLIDPNMRIADVAQSIGFNDQGDFTRMFRRICGQTPSEYRTAVQS